MLDLDRVEQFMSRFFIRDLDSGLSVPFVFKPNQKTAIHKFKEWVGDGNPLNVICVKSRRVGFSKLSAGILFSHAASNPLAADLIVAHQYKSSVDLFQDPQSWSKSLPFALPDGTKQVIKFNHTKGESTLKVATAGSVSSGRGLTISGLHLSEAAYYPGQDSFTSLLPTVSSKDPNGIKLIESTANGKSGPGEIFYDYWQAAVEGKNGYMPIFLCFLNDPSCQRDEEEADDAPATDIERELMGEPYNATRAQIAWYRYIMESQCHGQEDTMLQEYPHNAEVAFLTSGDPAFSREELMLAHKDIEKEKLVGQIEMCGDAKAEFRQARGPWRIWEEPDGHSWYFFGVDAARGTEHGDFGCIKVINGHTGRCAARLAERVDPERLAVLLFAAIHYFGVHPNTVNIELTGNLGWVVQKAIRDGRSDLGIKAMSHVLHSWKPTRDDRRPGQNAGNALGWETTYRSRERMIIAFRSAVRSKRRIILDELLVAQMENAERSGHIYDFEVKRGHDDVFMGDMLAWICREDHPPPRIGGVRTWSPEEGETNEGLPMDVRAGDTTAAGCVKMMLTAHQKKIETAVKAADTPALLEGI